MLAVVVDLLVEDRLGELLVLWVVHFFNLSYVARFSEFFLLLLLLEFTLNVFEFPDLVQQLHCLGLLLILILVQLV